MSTEKQPHAPHYHFRIGAIYMMVAWLFFTLLSPLVRQVSKEVPMPFILCMQGVIGAIGVTPWVIKHGWESLRMKGWRILFFRTACGLLVYTFLFLSIEHTSLIDAFLLNNAAPLFIPLIVWIWLKTPIDHKLWPGLIGGFLGILLILKPGAEILNIGAIYGLAMAVFAALTMVAMRVLSYENRSHTILFHYFAFSALAMLPLVAFSHTFPSLINWVKLLIIGILSTLAQTTIIRALHHAKPSALGPFAYSAVIYAGILDWVLYGTKPDLFSWIGIILICFGGIWSLRFSKSSLPANMIKR